MPENEFEKQVQKKLGELRLDPSAPVWEKIEKEIREKKRRRIIFFFILPAALLLLGYSIYYFINTPGKGALAQQQVTALPINEKKEIPVVSKENTIQQTEPNKTNLLNDDKNTQKHNSLAIQQDKVQVLISEPSVNHSKKETGKYKNDAPKITQDNSIVIDNTPPPIARITKTTSEEENKIKDETVKATLSEDKIQKDKIATDSQTKIPVKKDGIAATPIAVVNKETAPIVHLSKQKIKWGIDFSAGATSNQSQLFSLDKSLDASAVYNPVSVSGGLTGLVNPPSSVRKGLAFRIGIVGELKVSKRSRISAALQYAYASNKIKTGSETDTTFQVQGNSYSTPVNRVYRGTQQNDYTNRYHFISVPIGYHWQINKNKKWQLQWDAGVSFSYLLATNALVYSSSYGGIYYRDKQAVNKMHFDISTGLSLRFAGKKGMEWVLGPAISFDTRKLINDGYGPKQYFFYGALHTRILFPQKKK